MGSLDSRLVSFREDRESDESVSGKLSFTDDASNRSFTLVVDDVMLLDIIACESMQRSKSPSDAVFSPLHNST